jgi:hypothetical protein
MLTYSYIYIRIFTTIASYQQIFIADYLFFIIMIIYLGIYLCDLMCYLLTISVSIRFCNLVKDPWNVNE